MGKGSAARAAVIRAMMTVVLKSMIGVLGTALGWWMFGGILMANEMSEEVVIALSTGIEAEADANHLI